MLTTEELQALSDADFNALQTAVAQESHRRVELITLPTDIDAMTQRFVNHGGDKTKLRNPASYEKNPRNPTV